MKKILMVCLGNICRSPIAEGILRHLALSQNLALIVDSAGTSSVHAGEPPHRDSVSVCTNHGVDISMQRSRPFSKIDFEKYDYILTMDDSNYRNVVQLARSEEDKNKVYALMSYATEEYPHEVPDPYYHGGFEKVYEMILAACQGFLKKEVP